MNENYELAIIGGGPAGLTAGIYGQRSGVETIVFDDGLGGIVTEAPMIENYPGYKKIEGMELATKFREHAEEYCTVKIGMRVAAIAHDEETNGFQLTTSDETYRVMAVVIATGTTHRTLGIPGEAELKGRGVSYCATCDGFFFKDRDVVVIGGGSSAVMEALYLHGVGANVAIIHRRDRFRAEEFLCRECELLEIPVIWDSTVEAIEGENAVEQVRLKNKKTGETTTRKADGVFISVGELPQTELAKQIGVELDEHGYIATDRNMRTNVKGIYAAGDVIGGVRQIVTACGEGTTAALTALEVLGKQYPY